MKYFQTYFNFKINKINPTNAKSKQKGIKVNKETEQNISWQRQGEGISLEHSSKILREKTSEKKKKKDCKVKSLHSVTDPSDGLKRITRHRVSQQ